MSAPAPPASGPRVLVVEDEFLIRMTLFEALSDDGFDVVVGNPPFRSHQMALAHDTDAADALRRAYPEVVGGETNLAAFFLAQGMRVRIDQDDRVYLGGWTRMMLRRAR